MFRKQMREEMNDLMDDLDRERKKRAEMEIDIDRLRQFETSIEHYCVVYVCSSVA